MSVLAIERVEVGESRIEALVRVTDSSAMRTSAFPQLPTRALELMPRLAWHSCENDAGLSFAREFRDTETVHLLEHVTIELMALSGSPRSLRGRTVWDFDQDGHGVFRVQIEYDDDLVALGALKEAVGVVEWLVGAAGPVPDIGCGVAQLRALRGDGAGAEQTGSTLAER